MTSDISLFSITHLTSSVHPIHTVNDSIMTTTHTNTIVTLDLTIDHTYLVSVLFHNLLYVGQLCELGLHLHFFQFWLSHSGTIVLCAFIMTKRGISGGIAKV